MEKKSFSSSARQSFNIYNDPKRSFSTESTESFIFLVLDCYSYTAGEKVTGEILLSLSEDLKNVHLKLSSKGTEEVQVFGAQDRSQKVVEELIEVYTLNNTLNNWDALPIGQYVFPFNFKLPSFCPATFYYSGEDVLGNYIKAEVLYSISIKLELDKGQSLSHSRLIHIKNCNNLEKPAPALEATAELAGCCFNKGSTGFKLAVCNTEHCQVDGEVKYKLLPNNAASKSPINQIIGSVILDFEVSTKKGIFKIIKKLSEVNRATWISAFTSLIYEKDFEYISDLKVASDELNPSSNKSALIKCEYFIECLVFYDIYCMKTPIVIRLPFHVNPKISYRKETPILPPMWNPVESSIFSFVVETSFSSDGMINSSLNIN